MGKQRAVKIISKKKLELKSESLLPGETIKTPSIQRTGKGANQDVIITTPITTDRPNRHHHEREKGWVSESGELSLSFAVGSRERQPQSMGYGENRLLSLLLIGYEIAQWLAAVIMAAQMQQPYSVAGTIEHLKWLFFFFLSACASLVVGVELLHYVWVGSRLKIKIIAFSDSLLWFEFFHRGSLKWDTFPPQLLHSLKWTVFVHLVRIQLFF